MKRTHKSISLAYLITAGALVFLGRIQAAEPVKEGEQAPVIQPVTESEDAAKKAQEEAALATQSQSLEAASLGEGTAAETQELEAKQDEEPSEKSSEIVEFAETTQKGPASPGIEVSVTDLTIAQVREIWSNLKTLLESVLDLVKTLVPPLGNQYFEKEIQAMEAVVTHTNQLIDQVNAVLAGIDTGTINQKNVHEQLESILSSSREFANAISTARAQNPRIANDRYFLKAERAVNVAVGDAVGQLGRLFTGPITVK